MQLLIFLPYTTIIKIVPSKYRMVSLPTIFLPPFKALPPFHSLKFIEPGCKPFKNVLKAAGL
jgi:hypothetical protein